MEFSSIAAPPTSQGRLTSINDFKAPIDALIHSDDALVQAAKMGDDCAFAQLIQRYQRFCWSKAYSILRNRGDAEDEVQSSWFRVWSHLDSYEGHGNFAAWISRIVSNGCLMRLRKARVARTMSVDEVFDSGGSFRLELIDQRAQPEQSVGNDQISELLNSAIRGVPPLLREVLVMRDLRQRAMHAIAADLGISIPAAKSRLMRARAELKRRLEKHHGQRGCGSMLYKPIARRATYVRAN